MQNVTDIQTNLSRIFTKLDENKISIAKASALSKIALKMIDVIKVELAYHALRKVTPELEFFNEAKNITPAPAVPAITDGRSKVKGDRYEIAAQAIKKLERYKDSDPTKASGFDVIDRVKTLVDHLYSLEVKP